MGLAVWIILFLVLSAICAWLTLGNGVDTISGFVAAYLLGASPAWNEDGIRLYVWLTWGSIAVWFVLGLIYPDVRWMH